MKNIVKIRITFTRVYNNPTFASLFNRIPGPIKTGVTYEFSTNHTHLGRIKDMQGTFNNCYKYEKL